MRQCIVQSILAGGLVVCFGIILGSAAKLNADAAKTVKNAAAAGMALACILAVVAVISCVRTVRKTLNDAVGASRLEIGVQIAFGLCLVVLGAVISAGANGLPEGTEKTNIQSTCIPVILIGAILVGAPFLNLYNKGPLTGPM